MNNRVLLYSIVNNVQYPVINHNGKEYLKKMCVCVVCVYILEKAMATHCSILAWRILWAEEPGGL